MGDLQAAELGEKHRILGSPCPELTLVWGLEWQASLRISPAQYYHSQHKRKYTQWEYMFTTLGGGGLEH